MKKIILSVLMLGVLVMMVGSVGAATESPIKDSIIAGADRLVATQNNDGGWLWENPTTGEDTSSTNTFGVTALGLLDAYKLTTDSRYLAAAEVTGESLVVKVPDATSGKFYSQDIEFLVELGEITAESKYTTKAENVMTYFMTQDNRYCATDGCTALELADKYANIYPTIAGLTEWQLASWVRAAKAVEKIIWANEMISEMNADIGAYFNMEDSIQDNYILGLSGIISATGNSEAIQKLKESQETDGFWIEHEDGDTNNVQATAYAVMALMSVNEMTEVINGALWLVNIQLVDGGWNDPENTEVTSEAIQAISDLGDIDGSIITPGDTPIWPNCVDEESISATITDISGIKFGSVKLNYKYDGFEWGQISFMNEPIDDVYEIAVNWFTPTNNEPFRYYIEAKDNLENIGYAGSEGTPFEFLYDCANPVASVTGEPGDWVQEGEAYATCTDTASECNADSYLLYVSTTDSCSDDVNDYIPGSQDITEHSWVCSYVEDNAGNSDFSDPVEFLVDGVNPTADANGPYPCDEGETIILDGSGSLDDLGGALTYNWGFGSSDVSPDYTCGNGDGTETVSLEVTDHVGNIGTATATINVNNVAPVLNVLTTFDCNEGETITLTASATDFDSGLIYTWDTDEDGVYDDSSEYVCVDGPAVIDVSVQVTDGEDTDEGTTTVTIDNVAPVVDAGADDSGNEGSAVALSGSATDAGSADTHTYAWDLDNSGDYETSGEDVNFNCVDDGEYLVGLEVTDDDGGIGTGIITVTCNNIIPVVVAPADTSGDEGSSISIGEITFSDVGISDTHTATINWGDENTDNLGTVTSAIAAGQSHTYSDDGTYTVTITVTDDDGGVGTDILEIVVEDLGPTASLIGTVNAQIGASNNYDASGSSSSPDDIAKYEWDWSYDVGEGFNADADTGTTNNADHAYSSEGVYTVAVRVIDEDGSTDIATFGVTVSESIISFDTGWNLFSIPLVPGDTSIDSVLGGDILANAEKIWAYREGEWDYNMPLSDGSRWQEPDYRVIEIVPGYGYYLKMTDSAILYHNGDKYYNVGEGDLIPMPPQVRLTTGWNLIGHYGTNNVLKSDEKYDLSGGLLTDLANVNMLNEDGNPVETLIPGEGYWAFITGQDSLWYAPSEEDYSVL